MEEYYVVLAYSNIQQCYSIPTIVSGVVATKKNVEELRKLSIPNKDKLVNRTASLSELQQVFDIIKTFLEDFGTFRVNSMSNLTNHIGESYIHIARHFLDGNLLRFIGKIRTISYRKIVSIPGFENVPISNNQAQRLSEFADDITAKNDNDPDPLLQCARILARMEYEQLRLRSPDFAIDIVKKDPTNCVQLLKLSYRSPNAIEYNDYFVGYPTLAFRDYTGSLTHFPLKPQTKINIRPIFKFCSGLRINGSTVPCSDMNTEIPFGQPIFNSSNEQCSICRGKSKVVECLRQKPRCNGFEAKCGNEEFAGTVCTGSFGVYITRFFKTLKVGIAFLPNLVGRLLDQGANSALLIYPIEGIGIAWTLEKALSEHLDRYFKKGNNYGIEKVRTRVSPKERLLDFSDDWNRDDSDLLIEIEQLLKTKKVVGKESNFDLSNIEMHHGCFLDNYFEPKIGPSLLDYKIISTFDNAKGKILGYRGSIFFLNSKKLVDFSKLNGFVCEGNLC